MSDDLKSRINEGAIPPPSLTERLPTGLISEAVSLSRFTLSNGAAVVSAEPFQVKMPEQQWAYGIIYPLNHEALRWRSIDAPCVLQIKLFVETGTIGVAGCDREGIKFTTSESFAQGMAQIRIFIADPMQTAAIVLRPAGSEKDVRITVLEIDLFNAGDEALAPRGHDLGYDLFIILSLGKTGTQTIEAALHSLSPFARVHRVHYASAKRSQQLRISAANSVSTYGPDHEIVKARKSQADAADRARSEIETIRSLGGRIAFITSVREPIGRGVSGMFQDLPVAIPVYSDLYALSGPAFAQLLAEGLVAAWDREIKGMLPPCVTDELWFRCLSETDYFSEEFPSVTGFDLLHHNFDPHLGYAQLENVGNTALVFRTSALNQVLSPALAQITGRVPNSLVKTNAAADKKYAALYADVLSRMRLPTQLSETIYRQHSYMKHFFDEAELVGLIRRWRDR